MLRKLKKAFSEIAQGTPGRRFVQHHERHRQSEGLNEARWKTTAYVAAGLMMLIAGLLLSIPPGVPGFLIWIPALGLLVARSRTLATGLDRTEQVVRRTAGRFGKS